LPRGAQTAKDDKTAKLTDDRKKLSDHGLKDGGTLGRRPRDSALPSVDAR